MAIQSVRQNQGGVLNALLLPFIVVVLLLIGAAAFGIWAFGQRQDYKNNVDQKIAIANAATIKTEDARKDAAFTLELNKQTKTYNGPADFGSIVLAYPRDWSAYVDETGGSAAINGFFQPNFVPSINTQTSSFALRLEVLNQEYATVLQQFNSYVKAGQLTSNPFALQNLPKVIGVKLDGKITPTKTGSMVILPLRDKTVELWTESPDYVNEFTANILPSFSFSP